MKTRFPKLVRIIIAGLILVGIAAVLFILYRPNLGGPDAVAKTRAMLRQQGFKTDLADFDFSTTAALHSRMAELTDAQPVLAAGTFVDFPNLMKPVGADSALVVWRQDSPRTQNGELLWPLLRETMLTKQPELDAAAAAILAGPVAFDLNAKAGNAMLLPHLAVLRNLAQHFGGRAVLELHDGNPDAAWTNLLAETCLVTAWKTEPVEISQLVRFNLTTLVYNATWQLLQTNGWPDEKLAALQREWETTDFLTNLPETMAFKRAAQVKQCQLARENPMAYGFTASYFAKELIHSPRSAWSELAAYGRQLRYRKIGTYADERALLLFYRDREIEFRNAVKMPTWLQMRSLPGVTNHIFFQSKYASSLVSMINLREINNAFLKMGSSFLGRAAESEIRRRILITAIALERFHGKTGVYPKTLDELSPELLQTVPVDFANGQPLHYRPTKNGHFILYSVALDGIDDGGKLPAHNWETKFPDGSERFDLPDQADLAWPQPATAAEMADADRQEQMELANKTEDAETSQAFMLWENTAQRQAGVETLLKQSPVTLTNPPVFAGRSLTELLHNQNTSGTNQLSLNAMLTLHQIITGAEPETVTFEVPLAFDALTNLGTLQLQVDPPMISGENSDALQCEWDRATNGDCLLVWSTIYECPGKHALQAAVTLNDPPTEAADITGPLAPFVISNLCQFSLTSDHFDPETGTTFRVKLPEANGHYAIELNTTNGVRLKTITGSTTNGVIQEHWDLVDEHGAKFTGDSFDSVLHLTLPDSGRTQILRGP